MSEFTIRQSTTTTTKTKFHIKQRSLTTYVEEGVTKAATMASGDYDTLEEAQEALAIYVAAGWTDEWETWIEKETTVTKVIKERVGEA